MPGDPARSREWHTLEHALKVWRPEASDVQGCVHADGRWVQRDTATQATRARRPEQHEPRPARRRGDPEPRPAPSKGTESPLTATRRLSPRLAALLTDRRQPTSRKRCRIRLRPRAIGPCVAQDPYLHPGELTTACRKLSPLQKRMCVVITTFKSQFINFLKIYCNILPLSISRD